MSILLDVMAPIALVAGCGILVGRMLRSDATALAKIVFYVLGPALVFRSIFASEVALDSVFTIAVVTGAVHVAMLGAAWLLGRVTPWDGDTRASASLVLTFPNCGNYGLPVMLFAFGEQGFALGMVFVLVSLLLQGTLGIGVASWRRNMTWMHGLLHALQAPYIYAFILAVLFRRFATNLPVSIFRAVDLLADAAIPGQLLMLGLQLARVQVRQLRQVGVTAMGLSFAKLIVPPLLAWGLTGLMGIDGLVRAVLVVQSGMPSAVNSIVLTANYGRDSTLAASTVLVSTALSLISVTLLLSWFVR